jgi:hypothetical protein
MRTKMAVKVKVYPGTESRATCKGRNAPNFGYTEALKPGKYDRRYQVVIKGAELRVLKELSLPESFGLERRVEQYQGKRPIGLYRWDLECLLDTLSLEMTDRPLHPRPRGRDLAALQSLYARLRKEYEVAYGPSPPSN